jgi:hypothetical protein
VRFSSENVDIDASVATASYNASASSSDGIVEITGPKNELPSGGAEREDRRAHVGPGPREGKSRLGPQHVVPRPVIGRSGQRWIQPEPDQDSLDIDLVRQRRHHTPLNDVSEGRRDQSSLPNASYMAPIGSGPMASRTAAQTRSRERPRPCASS